MDCVTGTMYVYADVFDRLHGLHLDVSHDIC